MRGKRHMTDSDGDPARIIPAHAGQTITTGNIGNTTTDHPRACGANAADMLGISESTGSSPRMRGKHRRIGGRFNLFRIIPAHAGQTA